MIQETTGAFANIEIKFEKVESRLDHMASSQKMLESQIGQIANKVGICEQGALPSQPDVNVKEQCKAITLRSGRELPEIATSTLKDEILPPKKRKKHQANTEISESVDNEPKKEKATHKATIKSYIPPIPFPQRLKNCKLENQYEKFLKMFREIHISIPFADALAQMPLYEVKTITLSEECSSIIQCTIPPKLKDPGSFSLLCTSGEIEIKKTLCDLGASVSLMPLSIYKRLGLGELKKTRISLQLADRSIKYPLGILEDVLVKVDRFVIPCDFVVLEMNEDVDILIILGRPFLATAGPNIDVKAGKLTLNAGEEKVDFDLNQAVKGLSVKTGCYLVDVREELVNKVNDHTHGVEAEIDAHYSPSYEFQGVNKVDITVGPLEMVSRYPP
ncbi:uncharacterized protein LOC141704610 [Apium graveolens]|uniref:uncharacterized protein LOC141704610 n=1 Tax=Apium graveolens TaxID=4045 RepID=UPI003D79F8EC